MAKQHRDILARLDPMGVTRYNITEQGVQTVEKYLSIIQGNFPGEPLWQQIIRFPSAYATSLVIHEIVEIRFLQAQGIDPLKLNTIALQQTLAHNIEAHIQAIYDEHLYLQDYVRNPSVNILGISQLNGFLQGEAGLST